ncbi:GntR family transcriptional regulator [Streptomyces sp. NPDC006458]|uniref:GntR family transcriptional regulator n=1 Tax=Streptomyces sp. NPDC006458 TaxID=3154302 RepID=UPI00339ED7BA
MSATSRHRGIADDLRKRITTGCFGPGERLPSETDLASHYRVSTSTLRNALALLQREGLVEKIHGRGNFVRHPLRKIMYVGGWGTLDPWTAAETALRVTVRTAAVAARGHLTSMLSVPPDTPLTEFTCVSHERDAPHSLARIYVPSDLALPGLRQDSDLAGRTLTRFAVLAPTPSEIRETVSARLPTPDEASALQIHPGTAVLAVTRIATDNATRVVEAALLVFPGDRVDAVFTTHHVTDERPTQR